MMKLQSDAETVCSQAPGFGRCPESRLKESRTGFIGSQQVIRILKMIVGYSPQHGSMCYAGQDTGGYRALQYGRDSLELAPNLQQDAVMDVEYATYPPPDGYSQEQLISSEQMHRIYSQTKTAVLGHGVAAVLLSVILWDISEHKVILGWLFFIVCVLVARYALYAVNKADKSADRRADFWIRIYTVFAFLSGAAWGATGIIFFTPDSTLYHVLISMWILGVSAGGVIGYSVNLRVATAFFLPCVLPASAYMFYIGDSLHVLVGLGLLVYAIIAIITLLPIHRSIMLAIRTNLELHQELTKRKQIEIQLSESEGQFKALFDHSPDPCWIIDEHNLFRLCNIAAAKTLGYSDIEELASVHPSELSPEFQPDGRESYEKANEMMAIAQRQGVHRFEWSHCRKNGDCFPVEVTLSRLESSDNKYLYCVWRDITERKKAEESLRKLSQAVEQAGESILITDKHGTIEYVNPSFTRMTGYTPEEVMGKNPRVLKSGNQTSEYYQNLWQTITSGKVWSGTISDRRKDGSQFPAIMSISPILDGNNQISHYVGIQQDMTDHQLLEEKFHQAQKMEAIGTLVGGIAHDFNNILAGITGNLYLAKKRSKENPGVQKQLTAVEELSFRAAGLIDQLLTFARKDRVVMQHFSLTPFIKETLKLLRASTPENIAISHDICTDALTIKGDATQLHQVLMNLVNNARDAVEDVLEPAIAIKLEAFVTDDQFIKHHPYFQPGRYAHLSVTDNGVGVPDGSVERIFEPFFTTKEQGKGTGLGLAMAFGAIKTHDGFIEVDSAKGEGSTFHVYLPLVEEEMAPVSPDQEQEALHGNGECILLVDDEADILMVGVEILETLGYQVLSAPDGVAAVDLFLANQDKISLVITDIVMPNLGGIKAIERIREVRPDVKVIFTTGYDKRQALPDAVALGTVELLTKPYNIKELSRCIANQLAS